MPGPPRFLLGLALLFWGVMTKNVVPGLALALLVEGAHWSRVRWNFGDRAFLMAWRLTVLFLLVAMVLVLLQGARFNAMPKVFTWLPVIMLPLQFVQSYGMSRTTTLATFSMMVRRRREHARKFGLPFREVHFSFGHVYFCAALLGACLGPQAGTAFFYPGLVILVSWALIASSGRLGKGLGHATLVALLAASLGGLGGQKGLSQLYRYVLNGGGNTGRTDARERRTSFQDMKEIKQSPEIQWRLIPESGPLPRLLRIASYSTYYSTNWLGNYMPEGTEARGGGFTSPGEITNPANPDDPEDVFIIAAPDLPDPKVAADPSLSRFRLRGATPSGDWRLLPLPADTASLHEFDPEDLERNPFGTFRLKPSQPICDARVLWGEDFATELPPWTSIERKITNVPPERRIPGKSQSEEIEVAVQPDLQIPPAEAAGLREVVDELGLREGSLKDKIDRLQDHFYGFRYTRYNAVRQDFDSKKDGTMIRKFLTDTKAGHCEYFATAAALLLREAGVPTRYVSGFAVVEFDSKRREAVLRGTHAHAWCRAWDAAANRWLDVDLTPPDWLGKETPRPARFQDLNDWIQRQREDLLVWRDKPGHMLIVTICLLAPILVGLAFVGRNLWRSRSRLDPVQALKRGAVTVAVTPLLELEKPARKILGERPPGTPLARWLVQLSPRLARPDVLAQALKLHHLLRFDPASRDPALVAELQGLVADLKREL